jgi:5,10-methylenetetrahydromethanopterin reductase
MTLKYGVGMGRTESINEVAAQAKLAESLGYDHVTFIDSQSLSRDNVAMMTVAAANTSRIRIGPGVTQPFTRHMAVCANAIATVDELSGGRAFLGISGGMSSTGVLNREMGRKGDMQTVADAVEFFRAFTHGDDAEWDGVTMHSEWVRREIPVIIGAGGPKRMRQAVSIGDGAFMPGVHPGLVKWRLARLEEGARDAGRPLNGFEAWIRTMVYVDPDHRRARDEVRAYAATCAYGIYKATLKWDNQDAADLRSALPAPLVEEILAIGHAYNMYEHEKRGAQHAAEMSDELIDAMVVSGPAERCVELIQAMQEVGVTRVSMVLYSLQDRMGAMQRFAEQVLPKLS